MSARPRLILASGSPRRRQALATFGLDFEVRPADLDESPRPGEAPEPYVRRLAQEKAEALAHAGELILAADTIVALEGALLGKPRDTAEAVSMLGRLQGREHQASTGVALHVGGTARTLSTVVTSTVRFTPMSPAEIRWYAESGEPLDRAGAYAIQGLGALFVESIEGNYSNIVGLPLPATARLFRSLGYELLDFRATS
jgi:septum formation protein